MVRIVIYCLDPANPRFPDQDYKAESEVAKNLGIPFVLLDHDALVHENDLANALRRVPEKPQSSLGLYRCWMMTTDQYRLFYEAISVKGIRLLNDPTAFRHCHHLPESYQAIESLTPPVSLD